MGAQHQVFEAKGGFKTTNDKIITRTFQTREREEAERETWREKRGEEWIKGGKREEAELKDRRDTRSAAAMFISEFLQFNSSILFCPNLLLLLLVLLVPL
ncbi:hypothetical protein TIFTF001_029765 [Ficus carica]|uniref:Uncharacterized protein n=1 Tax=Ficus carica TaxID=3494 RepID=A0AA88DSF6_FICCA|nr:hypothetical protein TIFTF001_029765 [Ficus carica]